MFKAELWDPDAWANLFKNAGAKCKSKFHSLLLHNNKKLFVPAFTV